MTSTEARQEGESAEIRPCELIDIVDLRREVSDGHAIHVQNVVIHSGA
jgi:hypothetical protein